MENSEITKSLPINFTPLDYPDKSELFEITIPHLKGIELRELAKVLNDYSDLLSSFRSNIKQLITQAKKDGKHVEEMKNDIIRPQVGKISFEFKHIKDIHKLKVYGTTFTTITLGLLAYNTSGIEQEISAFIGTEGLGMYFKNEIDYKKEIHELAQLPLYIMWELKKIQS